MTDPTRPPPRDRTRALLKKLATYAVAAAIPVTNTACDPAPEPYCQQAQSDWLSRLSVTAAWVDTGGGTLAADIVMTGAYPVDADNGGATVTGGQLGTSPDPATTLRIVPDPGATVITVSTSMICDRLVAPLRIQLGLTGARAAGDVIPATTSVP